jgi:hypothetical protein
MIRFGSLEFPALSPTGMRVSPIFEPAQAFRFGSLDFVVDQLGVLHLREEARDLAPVGGTPSIDSRTRDFNGAASALLSEQTLCSNPAPPYGRFPYGLASSAYAYARGLQKVLAPHPLTSEFVGMVSYAPTCFLDIMDDDVGSNGSSIGDVAPSHRRSREYAAADAVERPLGVTESFRTHAPPSPHAETPELTREHREHEGIRPEAYQLKDNDDDALSDDLGIAMSLLLFLSFSLTFT